MPLTETFNFKGIKFYVQNNEIAVAAGVLHPKCAFFWTFGNDKVKTREDAAKLLLGNYERYIPFGMRGNTDPKPRRRRKMKVNK